MFLPACARAWTDPGTPPVSHVDSPRSLLMFPPPFNVVSFLHSLGFNFNFFSYLILVFECGFNPSSSPPPAPVERVD